MFKSSTSPFDKLLEKATSLTNLEPDWGSIMQICDAIRQNDVQPRYALSAIKRKLNATNPNVQLMALKVLESCVKNCGPILHFELATKEFMEEMHTMLRNSSDIKVKNEILRLIQAWAHAFRKEPSFKAVSDQMRLMKAEGFQFPTLKESDAMFSADLAPEWSDGECCHRCRTSFTVMNRKHHCRHCGQVFCAKCSAKTSTIPKFGIEKEVRVCDLCYDKINKKIEIKTMPMNDLAENSAKAKGSANSSNPTTPTKTKTEQEIQEEEELQLALALSKKMRQFRKSSSGSTGQSNKSHKKSSGSKSSSKSKSGKKSSSSSAVAKTDLDIENDDPELARYLNREYWEQRSQSFGDYEPSPSPSAPTPISTNNSSSVAKVDNESKMTSQNKFGQQNDAELENFMKNLQSTIEIFVNRLQSNKLRGRPITNDSGVQALFMNLTNMHSHLMMYMQQTSESRSNCERLQDKIQQIRDARAALDALRDEHRDQLKRAAAEAERLRQQQMAQKLDIMRKQKQQYLQYQRELAIQRMQEQERELMMRTELLKFGTNPASIPQPQQPQPQMPWNSSAAMGPYHPHPGTYYQPTSNPHGMAAQPPSQMMAQPPQQYPPASMPDHTVAGGPNSMIPQQSYYMPQHQHQPVAYMAPHSQQPQTVTTNNGYAPATYGGMQAPPHQSQQHPEQLQQQQQQPEPVKEPIKEELLINFD
ncbi:hypothetical protein DERP_009274 [Dermatophagoides pteronyssinus]|uniref:Hepatocyte growth factor-regulated tyrosine kinase substrate n=1 Tax=Dermatophagoides pteronyssinus TaxID=6956 RepID=A0ABQ8ITC8_DERPT|nr:hypothetical protein DERP_009274 [Dermatophagoides pteronyssinus]